MIRFKIYVAGKNTITGLDAESTFEITTPDKDLELFFGKALYGVETQGFPFETAAVYDEAVETFDIKLKNTYQKVFSKETDFGKIEVSLKAI